MKKQLTILLFALAALTPLAHGQLTPQLSVPNSPAYEAAANRLRNAPPRQYDFAKAVLPDVLRLMAADAGISFFGLPEGASGTERLVTFTISASPFSAMETLCKANGVSLIFENDAGSARRRHRTIGPVTDRTTPRNWSQKWPGQHHDRQAAAPVVAVASGGSGSSCSVNLNLQGLARLFCHRANRLLEDVAPSSISRYRPHRLGGHGERSRADLLPGLPASSSKSQNGNKDGSASAGSMSHLEFDSTPSMSGHRQQHRGSRLLAAATSTSPWWPR
ncbi:MAG: hypothetical protein H7A53_04285 [Akkermansiaceae bacterium]|nr:hypothetical protein [Akkermansiaceae bacterium]